eukprot:COSAG02_NODE_297_length_25355_cov_78.632998_16_plen_105_part_00
MLNSLAFLETKLKDPSDPQTVAGVLLPCGTCVAVSYGGKIPNNATFCETLVEQLDENPEAVDADIEFDPAALASNELHPTYDTLLTLLSDPFIQYIVVPQLLLL